MYKPFRREAHQSFSGEVRDVQQAHGHPLQNVGGLQHLQTTARASKRFPYERAKTQLPMLIQQLGGTDDTLKPAEDLIKAVQDFQTHIEKRGRVQHFVERLQPSDNSAEFCPNLVVRAL